MANQNNDDQKKDGVNPIVAAVTGAAVGAAAVGVATAAVLTDDDSRKKVEKVIDKAKDNVADIKADVEEKIAAGQEKVNEIASAVTDSVQNAEEDTK